MDIEINKTAYELSFLIDPAVGDDKLSEEVGKVHGIIEKAGGKVGTSESPRLRNLAYTIERSVGGKRSKYNQAYFGWLNFEAPNNEVDNISKEVNSHKTIIRSLLIHAQKKNVAPVRSGVRKAAPAVAPAEAAVKPSEAEIEKEVDNLIASTTNVSK